MKLSEELIARGFVHQFSSESLEEIVDGDPKTVYHGIDPTADSAHVGNLTVWMLLNHLARAGFKIVFLVGGGTGMIGDPKPDVERTLTNPETVRSNVEKISAQAQHLIGGENSEVVFVNNAQWLSSLALIEFLRDTGKYFTVNELIKKDAISTRLESEIGLSYTEFAYPLLQAYDYLQLYRNYDCRVQVGGSDQWGNIVAGVDLIRRKEKETVYALTTPLVVDKATGKKFGKSEGNAVWLDSKKTSPYQFYQFWLNVSDESAVEYLKLFTFLTLDEIEEIAQAFNMNPGARLAQKRLAEEVTIFIHGKDVTESVKKVSHILFGEGDVEGLTEEEHSILLSNAPTHAVSGDQLLIDVLVESGLASSKREARTFIDAGAVTLGGKKVTDVEFILSEVHFKNNIAILRRGKKQMSVLVLE